MTTNEDIYKSYKASGWTRRNYFDALAKECARYDISFSWSAFEQWMRAGTNKNFRTAPAPVARVAKNMMKDFPKE